jgi:hypothetical protein
LAFSRLWVRSRLARRGPASLLSEPFANVEFAAERVLSMMLRSLCRVRTVSSSLFKRAGASGRFIVSHSSSMVNKMAYELVAKVGTRAGDPTALVVP